MYLNGDIYVGMQNLLLFIIAIFIWNFHNLRFIYAIIVINKFYKNQLLIITFYKGQ
jgi:hypothetical protein